MSHYDNNLTLSIRSKGKLIGGCKTTCRRRKGESVIGVVDGRRAVEAGAGSAHLRRPIDRDGGLSTQRGTTESERSSAALCESSWRSAALRVLGHIHGCEWRRREQVLHQSKRWWCVVGGDGGAIMEGHAGDREMHEGRRCAVAGDGQRRMSSSILWARTAFETDLISEP